MYKENIDARVSPSNVKAGHLYQMLVDNNDYLVMAIICDYGDTFVRVHTGHLMSVNLNEVELYEIDHELVLKTTVDN